MIKSPSNTEYTGQKETGFSTPVLLIIFNRPDTTRRVFEAIRNARPKKLFIAADGPRENKPGEMEKCLEVRKIVSVVDWECDVKTLFRDKNVGCGRGPAGAMSWFFSQVEEGIILEDDCLPSPDFFRFCASLLERYRNDTRVMQIGGINLVAPEDRDDEYSYSFSNHNYIWGWATWRRAWNLFRFNMDYYDVITEKKYHSHYYKSKDEEVYFKFVFDQTYSNIEHTSVWDYQWQYSRMLQAGLSIVPCRNLVINLGYGADATHTNKYADIIPKLQLEQMDFPLRHPEFMMPDLTNDELNFRRNYTTPMWRLKRRLKAFIPSPLLKFVKTFLLKHEPAPMVIAVAMCVRNLLPLGFL